MKLIICKLTFVVMSGNIPWQVKNEVEGKILKIYRNNALVDFREGLKEFPLTKNPQNYSKILVNLSDCVVE